VAASSDYNYFDPFRVGPANAAISAAEIRNSGFRRVPSISTPEDGWDVSLGRFSSRSPVGTAAPAVWRSETAASPVRILITTPARVLYCCIRMGSLLFFAFSWWGILLQAFAIVHFIRRRPDTFWLWIILIGGWLGALVYIAVEAVPDAACAPVVQGIPRRKRIRELESAVIDNPSAGNYEELGDLYLEEGHYAKLGRLTIRRFRRAPTHLTLLPSRRGGHPDARLRGALPTSNAWSPPIQPMIFIAPRGCSLTRLPTPASPKKRKGCSGR